MNNEGEGAAELRGGEGRGGSATPAPVAVVSLVECIWKGSSQRRRQVRKNHRDGDGRRDLRCRVEADGIVVSCCPRPGRGTGHIYLIDFVHI